jgi:predicted PurR-regulated permease PerM
MAELSKLPDHVTVKRSMAILTSPRLTSPASISRRYFSAVSSSWGCLQPGYVAAEIILPTVLAFVLKLVLQPVMRALRRLHLPQGAAALLIIVVLFGTFAGLGTALSAPAVSWAQKLPAGIPKLQERLRFLYRPALDHRETHRKF